MTGTQVTQPASVPFGLLRLLSLLVDILGEGPSSSTTVMPTANSSLHHDPVGHASHLATRVLVSLIAQGVRATSATLFNVLVSKFTVRLELDSRDELFAWTMEWLAQEHRYGRDCTHVAASSKARPFAVDSDDDRNDASDNAHVLEPFANGDDLDADDASSVVGCPRPIYFFPSAGVHFFWYKWRLFVMTRSTKEASVNQYGNSVTVTSDTITLYTLGLSRKAVAPLLKDIRARTQARDLTCTAVFTGDRYGNWCRLAARPSRPLDSVVIDHKVKEDLVQDVKQFMRSAKFYTQTGLPYRRGYLLYGPPGTGKSSLVVALAGSLNLPIYVLNLGSNAIDDYNLLQLLIDAPTRCILLLEDIHTLFKPSTSESDTDSDSDSESESDDDNSNGKKKCKRKRKARASASDKSSVPEDVLSVDSNTSSVSPTNPADSKLDTHSTCSDSDSDSDDDGYSYTSPEMNSKISLATLLNVLDGVIASEGRLLFMTTNSTHLDPAILRPGRIDRKLYLGNATPAIAKELARRFLLWEDGSNSDDVQAAARVIAKEVAKVGKAKDKAKDTHDQAEDMEPIISDPDDGMHRESNLSPAQVVGFLMRYREDPLGAIANIHELRTMHELVAI